MRSFLQRLMYRFSAWMCGRYGSDELNLALVIVSVGCGILSCFPFLWFFSTIGTALLIWACYRTVSRNVTKRRQELDRYYSFKNKATSWCSLRKKMFAERKTHRYFKCKTCKTVLRVPKRNNKIEVTCPKCRQKTIK